MPTFGSTGTSCGLGGTCFCIGNGAVVSSGVLGGGGGCTASTDFCESVLANLGVDVTLSTSSSTVGWRVGARCATDLSTNCGACREVAIAGLVVDTGLEHDMVGVEVVDGGFEIGISSSVTLGCEKRVDAEDD